MTQSDLLTIPEAAVELQVTPPRVYQLIHSRNLETLRIDGRQYLKREDVDRLKLRLEKGRPKSLADTGTRLPEASPETIRFIHRALERLDSHYGQDLFKTAPGGKISLDDRRLRLQPAVFRFFKEALRPKVYLEQTDIDKLLQQFGKKAVFLKPELPIPPEQPDRLMVDVPIVQHLTYGNGLFSDQAILIYGRPGTLKTRLAALFAVNIVEEKRLPILYYPIGTPPEHVKKVLEETQTSWCEAEIDLKIRFAAESADKILAGPTIEIQEIALDLEQLGERLAAALVQTPEVAAIIIDSIGPLGDVPRMDLFELLINTKGRTVILIGEEGFDSANLARLDTYRWAVDLELGLSCELPNDQTRAIGHRHLEIRKSRRQPMKIGRHAIEIQPDGRLAVYPSVESWADYTEESKLPAYNPGFSTVQSGNVPDAGALSERSDLTALDNLLRAQHGAGLSIVLWGGQGTFKDTLGIYAATHAVEAHRTAVIISLRQNAVHVVTDITENYPQLNKARVAVCEYDAKKLGKQPEIQVMIPPLGAISPEKLLWTLWADIRASGRQSCPVGLVVFEHFSELIASPQFLLAPLFGVAVQKLFAQLKVTIMAQVDPETWSKNLRYANLLDLLLLFDVRLTLECGEAKTDTVRVVRVTNGSTSAWLWREDKHPGERYLCAEKVPVELRGPQ